ncbi:MAG: glycoside hydrolase family 36 protein [Armatimonadota bacterium]
MAMRWEIKTDGTFSLSGGPVGICDAYPAIDGKSVRPLGVTVERTGDGGTIRYELAEGYLEIMLGRDERGTTVETRLGGMTKAPHRVAPLGDAAVEAARCFRQGMATGGPSGFANLPLAEPVDSYGITALAAGDGRSLVLSAHDHSRFLQHSRLVRDEDGRTGLTAWFRTEGIPLAGELALPALYLRPAADAWSGLREAAQAIAETMRAREQQPISYHWCSWYYLYYNLTEPLLKEYLAGFNAMSPPSGLQTIQIDAGYFPSEGDWLEANERFPNGLQAAFEKIRAAGFRPGIWIGPFMVGNRSRLFREYPDWILRDHDGKPYGTWEVYGEGKIWGYRDEEIYVLDSSHPEAMAYLKTVFETFRAWGAGLYKTDFMVWGLVDSARVRRHTPGKTSVEYFRDVLATIRGAIGEESFWLGCIAPFLPFVGYADAMRIGGDVGADWKGGFGPQNMLQESQADQYFNNVWWQNDPDAILVRDFHNHLTDAEVRSLALWQGILGGVICTSDPLHELSSARQALWRFLAPGEPWRTELPYFNTEETLRVAVRRFDDPQAWAVLIFNATDAPIMRQFPVKELTGEGALYAYQWGPGGTQEIGKLENLLLTVAPHSAELYYLAGAPAPPPEGLTLGGALL